MTFRKRFPIEKTRYLQCVGRLLPHRISQVFKELGFETWINSRQGNDIDLKVYLGDELIIVGEILNWSIYSKLSYKRKENIINNLSKYDCKKVLIYTILDDRDLECFANKGIDLIEIGYQLLPEHFYDHFLKKGQVYLRKIDSKETKREINQL